MISLESFSELLEVLYSTTLRQDQWGRFLDLICDHTGSMTCLLMCANHRVGLSVQEQGGVRWDPKIVEHYARNYSKDDPFRLPVISAGETGVKDCDQLLPYESLWNLDMFREVHQQVGACYATVMVLNVSLRRLEGISVWRTREQGQMTQDGTRLLQLLLPHIQLAMEIRYALGILEARAISAEAMANASRTATFLLTGRGEVLHMNAAADAQLAKEDGLVVEKGILMASSVRMRASLKSLLRDASQPSGLVGELRLGAAAARALSLERRSGRPPLQLLASPVPRGQAGSRYAVLLLVSDPEKPVDVTDDMMRTYYGFTRAETEIANGLLTGYSLLEIAALRRVAVGTVRIQLKSLFAKTGTTRQVDLVRMLLTLPQISQTEEPTRGIASLPSSMERGL